jgi:hypothetical protein
MLSSPEAAAETVHKVVPESELMVLEVVALRLEVQVRQKVEQPREAVF